MTPEEKHRIVNAAVKKLNFAKPIAKTPVDELLDKTQQITLKMRQHIQPILRAGGWKDKQALRTLIMTLYLEAFCTAFDKEALANLCAILHTEIAMENIESNPYDSDKGPDALSGL